jgi:hypothetical protein
MGKINTQFKEALHMAGFELKKKKERYSSIICSQFLSKEILIPYSCSVLTSAENE